MPALSPDNFSTPLLAWFAVAQRDMPWRRTRDPYAIWISEVMLQQTQVATVRDYWLRFMARFPTVRDLADAPQDAVLKLWEGLGYYRRARHLQAAAGEIVARHDGQLPADPAALRMLPGFGPYTAGAVAAIAFDLPEPAVDGNVLRVLARLAAWEDDVTLPATRRKAEALASALIPAGRAGDFAQALMELGALICTPRKPRCGECPVAGACRARQAGIAESLPRKAPRAKAPYADMLVAVVVAGDRVLVERRPERGMLGGLMAFPAVRLAGGEAHAAAIARAAAAAGVTAEPGNALVAYPFAFTHLRTTHHAYLAAWRGGEPAGQARWESVA
ncbi:MAG: A/G-specific adenine glycosylase, partial [Candidatus Sericytochromatia bacterium]|nr:A/G-specific adenine glycosylase [Candidatus Tanganyikabacteria bacterium]